MNSNEDYEALLVLRVIAVVGCSPKRGRPSNRVASYLMDAGYRVIPVNPGHAEILGERCYPELRAIPEPVDVVNIFRRPEFVPEIVEAAIAIKAKGIWMQDSICDAKAAERARSCGLRVVMDDCFLRQHLSRYGR